jgi:hypothetical protein
MFLRILALTAFVSYVLVYTMVLELPVIRSDGWGYYAYLPAVVIFGDPSFEALAQDCCAGELPAYALLFRWPETGRWMNGRPMGEALLVFPFFLIADWLTLWSNLSRDGFSFYYQYLSGLAGVFYLVVGLQLLKLLLDRDFSPGVVLATLVSITWGTNLFHYGTFDTMFSHVFAFFTCTALLLATRRFYETPSGRNAVLVGGIAGLTVLIRHTNVLILLSIPLFGVTNLETARQRIAWLHERWWLIILGGVTLVLAVVPQLAFYRYATGRWIMNPYGSDFGGWAGFHFASPKFLEVLFSTQKGLLFWSPILGLSILGFYFVRQKVPAFYLATLVITAGQLYLVASWFEWQFGSSYGHRAFTDLLPFFALGLAAFYDRIRESRLDTSVTLLATFFVVLSVIQMIQYWVGILPQAHTSWEQYRSLFLNFHR